MVDVKDLQVLQGSKDEEVEQCLIVIIVPLQFSLNLFDQKFHVRPAWGWDKTSINASQKSETRLRPFKSDLQTKASLKNTTRGIVQQKITFTLENFRISFFNFFFLTVMRLIDPERWPLRL